MTNDFKLAYEGKAKQLLLIEGDRDHYVQRFKNDATAFNGEKFAQFEGKGVLNCAISSHLFERLAGEGIDTHYVERLNATDQRVRKLEIIQLEVVVRNFAAGSLKRRLGYEEGRAIDPPIVETYFKKDALGDPILADAHVYTLDLVTADELAQIKAKALRINEILRPLFEGAGIKLVDFKMEFGFDAAGNIILGDEISPDTSRLWDMETDRSLDKDVFRHDRGDLIEAYTEVADRLDIDVEL